MAKAQFLGVYSLRSTKNASGKRYCFVWQDNAAKTCVFQCLTPDMKPTGKPMLLPLEQFRRDFTLEPGISAMPDIDPLAADYRGTAVSVPISDKARLISGPTQKPAAASLPPLRLVRARKNRLPAKSSRLLASPLPVRNRHSHISRRKSWTKAFARSLP